MKRSELKALARSESQKLRQQAVQNYWAVLKKLCHSHDYPRKEELLELIKARDFVSCVEIADSLSDQEYPDAYSHFVGNQVASLIRKYPFPGIEKHFNPEEVAFKRFVRSEARCQRMNRLFSLRDRYGRDRDNKSLQDMTAFIQYTIGCSPPLKEIWDECGFGPGASIGVGGNATNPARKLSAGSWTVTPGAYAYFRGACSANSFLLRALYPEGGGFRPGSHEQFNQLFESKTEVVSHNKIEFVPKTVKTFRSIAVEPLGNGVVQKGVDRVLRKRLRRIGIDLSDQAPNQQMARDGSLADTEDSFVTLDLESASDSISIGLCRRLLPPEWFELLNSIRSRNFMYKGNKTLYQKFCSMGNGFCFPLQSLIFTAICHSCGAGRPGVDFRVYGDDIIVRKKFAVAVIHTLFRCGFKLNSRKSHVNGPFRESCGADWFGGKDVRPYILDDPLDSVQQVFKVLNLTRSRPLWEGFFAPVRGFLLRMLKTDLHLFRPFPGPVDSGIDSDGVQHLVSPHCRYRGSGIWAWRELGARAIPDVAWTHGIDSAFYCGMYAATGGLDSHSPFTIRRKTKTTVKVILGGGASSNWLPTRAM